MIAEEDYDLFEDADKAKFSPVPTYGRRGQLVETFYVTADGTVGGATLRTKINAYSGVIVDKITAEEYDALSDEEKAGYEEESNVYFILMCVTDDRPLKTRFYEVQTKLKGYKRLKYPWYLYIYAFKPIIAAMIPVALMQKYHKETDKHSKKES